MNIESAFPSKYLKASDIPSQGIALRMNGVALEKIDKDERPVLYFEGAKKGMVLNVTNGRAIAKIYGQETEGWQGQEITLVVRNVDFRGETVPAIRVQVPTHNPAPVTAQPAGEPPDPFEGDPGITDDDIPF